MRRAAALTIASTLSIAASAQEDVTANRNYVALVVGVSAYENLPESVELDFARSDAVTVASTLRQHAGFNHVFELTDREATRENIRDTLRNKVAQLIGPNDVFLFYFVGHGYGADFGTATLLAHDSTREAGQEDGLELSRFSRDLLTWTQAGTTVLVTDAIHRNQLDGVFFFGPSANEWPALPPATVLISSSQSESPATDGAFGKVFADAMAGASDSDRDGKVTISELFAYLVSRTSPLGQIPVAAGDFDSDTVLAEGVVAGESAFTPAPVYPDHQIWSAKFVFTEGGSHSVQCRDAEIKACEPGCYVRNFTAGPCDIGAIVNGSEVRGRVIALVPGKYECGLRSGELACTPPMLGEPPKRPE